MSTGPEVALGIGVLLGSDVAVGRMKVAIEVAVALLIDRLVGVK